MQQSGSISPVVIKVERVSPRLEGKMALCFYVEWLYNISITVVRTFSPGLHYKKTPA